jgi:hypothetical protein
MKAHPLCHDVNFVTRSTTHLDVVAGFSSGDIIWFDPMTNKYSRINKKVAEVIRGGKWLLIIHRTLLILVQFWKSNGCLGRRIYSLQHMQMVL